MLVLEPDADADRLGVALRRPDGVKHLGEIALVDGQAALARLAGRRRRWIGLALALPPASLMEKRIELPLAARPHLAQVAANEIEHETPFSADELYWSASVAAIDPVPGRMTVRLLMARRAPLDPLLDRLARHGIRPDRLTGRHGAERTIPLWSGRPRWGLVDRGLLAAAVCVVLAALALPVLRQSLALADIEARIAALHDDYQAASALKRTLGGAAAVPMRDSPGQTLALMAALTETLPDDTYLQTLSIHRGAITLAARSTAAASLLGRLARDKRFVNPGFAGAVTRDPATGAESFSMTLGVAG